MSTHQGTREMCRHTKGPGKCVDTPRDQGNVSDCTGCQNLSNPTHQGTREMCRHTKGPGKCVDTPRNQENVSTHQGTREMCRIV